MNESITFTIFGGTGDLTFRKLLPALYNLYASNRLRLFRIVIIGRRAYSQADYCEIAREWVKQYARLPYRTGLFESFCRNLFYYPMDFTEL